MLGGEIAEHKGKLDMGYDADLTVFDWEGNVRSTWIMGKEVFRAKEVGEGDSLALKQ